MNYTCSLTISIFSAHDIHIVARSTSPLVITLIISGAFITGTFYPNKWVTKNIEKEFHQAEVKEVIYLGFVQPEFIYNERKTFMEASGKCVDFLNFTTDRSSRVPKRPMQ